MAIVVRNIKLMMGDRLKALVDVEVDGWLIRSFKILEYQNQTLVVRSPQLIWRDEDHQLRFQTMVVIPEDRRSELENVVLNAYEGELHKRGKGDQHA